MVTEETENPLPLKKLPPLGVIWHYTSVDVFERILMGELAFSHYRFMNDSAEIEYGRQLLERIEQEDSSLDKIVSDDLFKKINLFKNVYMFCLSRDGDNLYQWRSYTPKGGVAIGFCRPDLFSAIQDYMRRHKWLAHSMFDLCRCHYSEKSVRKVVSSLAHKAKNKASLCSCDKNISLYMIKVLRVWLSQKNPSFKEEQEERFLIVEDKRDHIQIINGKPMIVLSDSRISKSISHVRLSPHGDKEHNRLLVEILREKYGLSFSIEESNSSYNGK